MSLPWESRTSNAQRHESNRRAILAHAFLRSCRTIASRPHCKHLPRMTPGFGAGLIIPDLWQQEAIRALQQGKDVVVQAPTGSGKTFIFELFYPDLKQQAVFTVPTRALANDKLAEWRARGWDVGISTGDVAANLE